jgi:hypothetical protein
MRLLAAIHFLLAAGPPQFFVPAAAAAASEEKFKWNPAASEHPCTIKRMTLKEFKQTVVSLPPMYPEPLVIVDEERTRNTKLQHLSSQENILSNFPQDFHVTLSSSNSFSDHRRTIPLRQYIEEILVEEELTPDKLSNETWYLFGETYDLDWKKFLEIYEVPPCDACKFPELVALSFGIGNRGSGVQWHVHGPGFSEAVVGRKHWILQKERPVFHKDQTSRNWMEYTYTSIDAAERPYECTLDPGDLIYFPDMFWHATINLDRKYTYHTYCFLNLFENFQLASHMSVCDIFGKLSGHDDEQPTLLSFQLSHRNT